MGNSEVGHLNIGAGRVVFQELTRINRACADGSLAANPVLNGRVRRGAPKPGAALHLMGLVSDGGVHSTQRALSTRSCARGEGGRGGAYRGALLHGRPRRAAEERRGLPGGARGRAGRADRRRVHGPRSAASPGATTRWTAITAGSASSRRGVPSWRAEPCTDATSRRGRWQPPTPTASPTSSSCPRRSPGAGVRDGDAAVFFNFRPDRARELTRALDGPGVRRLRARRVAAGELRRA